MPQQVEVVRELPRISGSYTISIKGEPDVVYNYEGEVPKELMDAYEQVVGNGLAKISAGVPMGMKTFGTGVEAQVFVSMSCNQDAQTLHQTYLFVSNLSLQYGKELLLRGEAELRQILEQRKAQSGGGPIF